MGFHLKIFIVLDFEVVWPRRPQWPRKAELEGFQTMVILDPYDMTFDAVGVFGLAFWLLFKSTSSYCAASKVQKFSEADYNELISSKKQTQIFFMILP